MSPIKRWLTLGTLGTFFFMVIIDGTIVSIAIPTIARGLSVSTSSANLVISVYLIGISALLLMFGQLGDSTSRMRLFMWGTVVFTIGSLLSGWGLSFSTLIGGRIVQAIGASMTMANSYAIVTDVFPASELGRALGIESIFISLGALAGPGLGGLIITYLSWHYIFLINVPLGIICIFIEWLIFPRHVKAHEHQPLDYGGAVWMILMALVFYGATSTALRQPFITVVLVIVFVVGLMLFVKHERDNEHPLLDLQLFSNRRFRNSLIAALTSFIVSYFFTLLAPIYLQLVLEYSGRLTGELLMISPIIALVANPLAGSLVDHFDKAKIMTAGMITLIVAQALLVINHGTGEPWPFIIISVVLSLGTALFGTANNTIIMQSVTAQQRGMAGSTNSLMREVGLALGTTLASTLYYRVIGHEVGHSVTTALHMPTGALLTGQTVAYAVGLVILIGGLIAIWSLREVNADVVKQHEGN